MLIHDAVPAVTRDITPEGFLRVRARIARSGLHDYRASELGAPAGFVSGDTIRVYRPPEQVFHPDAIASFVNKPVTDGHPPAMIDAGNWRQYAVGHAGPAVTRDGDHLAADLLITDAAAVARAEAGAELSNGYHADFDFTPGTTPDGEPFDALQSNIRGNHIALVDAGRCGDTCRIGDEAVRDCGCGGALLFITIDGIAIETTAAGAEALERLRLLVEAKDGAVAALSAKALDDAAIEARVQERTAALDGARAIFGPVFEAQHQPTAAIRRAVVAKLLDASLAGRSDTYVEAAFDTLMRVRSGVNPLAAHLAAPAAAGGPDIARIKRDRFLTHAWKGDHGVR